MPGWSLYVIDRQTNCIIQRYPGHWDKAEEAKRLLEELPKPTNERFDYLVLRYDPNWKLPENTIEQPEHEALHALKFS